MVRAKTTLGIQRTSEPELQAYSRHGCVEYGHLAKVQEMTALFPVFTNEATRDGITTSLTKLTMRHKSCSLVIT